MKLHFCNGFLKLGDRTRLLHSLVVLISDFVEQRSAIIFFLQYGISAAETYRKEMSQKNAYKWYTESQNQQRNVEILRGPDDQ